MCAAKNTPQNLPTIAIIGAGVGGLVTATILQEAGYPVTLYEKSEKVGPKSCSWMSGGVLAPWCEAADTDPEVVAKGVQALEWWENHFKNFTRNGSLVLSSAHDRSEVLRYAERTAGHHRADQSQIAELEPALAGLFETGLFYPQEGHLDPREALITLAGQFEKNGGKLETGKQVSAKDLKEAFIIDCRGLAAREDLPKLRGVRGEMLRIRSHEVRFSRPIRLLHLRESIYIVPRKDGELMVGASSIESDWNGPCSVRTAARYLEACERLHPALGQAEILELGVGVRPAYPDNLPEVTQNGRIIYLNGFYRHGWLLSPWGGHEVLKRLQGKEAPSPQKECPASKIEAFVNGEKRLVPETMEALLEMSGFSGKTVATALNHHFIPASKRAETFLKTGDQIEIVTPMQGG